MIGIGVNGVRIGKVLVRSVRPPWPGHFYREQEPLAFLDNRVSLDCSRHIYCFRRAPDQRVRLTIAFERFAGPGIYTSPKRTLAAGGLGSRRAGGRRPLLPAVHPMRK